MALCLHVKADVQTHRAQASTLSAQHPKTGATLRVLSPGS